MTWFAPWPAALHQRRRASSRARLLAAVRHPSFSQALAADFTSRLSIAEMKDVWETTSVLLRERLDPPRRLAYVVLRDELLTAMQRIDGEAYASWYARLHVDHWQDSRSWTPSRWIRTWWRAPAE